MALKWVSGHFSLSKNLYKVIFRWVWWLLTRDIISPQNCERIPFGTRRCSPFTRRKARKYGTSSLEAPSAMSSQSNSNFLYKIEDFSLSTRGKEVHMVPHQPPQNERPPQNPQLKPDRPSHKRNAVKFAKWDFFLLFAGELDYREEETNKGPPKLENTEEGRDFWKKLKESLSRYDYSKWNETFLFLWGYLFTSKYYKAVSWSLVN